MTILHICAGWQKWNGAANIARMIMDEQRREGHEVSSATWAKVRELRAADEVWIHCGWLPCLWWAAIWGRNVHWMPEACYDPVRLHFHGWKKWLVGPMERWCLRRCDRIVATCEAEKGWIEAYLGKKCPEIEVMDVKRFFDFGRVEGERERDEFSRVERVDRVEKGELHLLYLGRRHPLKGVEYLEKAVAELNSNPVNPVQNSSTRSTCSTRLNKENSSLHVSTRSTRLNKENSSLHISTRSTRLNKENSSLHVSTRSTRLKIVSSAFGEELEKVWEWCDVLVLPTLSDNFGLVIAEALERGKCVITTDGAPAWGENLSRVERVERVDVSRKERKERKDDSRVERVEGGVWSGYGGRLIYLKGYREGTKEQRVELLRRAIELMSVGEMMAVS